MADDNVIKFTPKHDEPIAPGELADALLEDSIGEYDDVIVIGIDQDGETVISGSISNIAEVYELLASAAQNIALAHLDMIFGGAAEH